MIRGRARAHVGIAGRVGWGLADQALSSLTNFVLGVVVARTVGLTDFGAFSLAFAAYLIVAGLSRAVTAQPLLIRYGDVSNSDWRRGASAATGMALLIGATAAIVALSIALVADGSVRSAFLALALVLPGLVVQDAWRFAFFAGSRGRAAFVNDSVGDRATLDAVPSDHPRRRHCLLGSDRLGRSGELMAALVGMAQARLVPQPLAVRRWWREHRACAPTTSARSQRISSPGSCCSMRLGWSRGFPRLVPCVGRTSC